MKKCYFIVILVLLIGLNSIAWAEYEIIPLKNNSFGIVALKIQKETGKSWAILPKYKTPSALKGIKFLINTAYNIIIRGTLEAEYRLWDDHEMNIGGDIFDSSLEFAKWKGKENIIQEYQKRMIDEIISSQIYPLEKNEKNALAIRINRNSGKTWLLYPKIFAFRSLSPIMTCSWEEVLDAWKNPR